MRIKDCYNSDDFRNLAKKRLPSPIFHYIDGGADDEVTLTRNRKAYETCDLVPNVLTGVEKVDLSTTVMGQKLEMPLFCSPTASQRLFHHEGEHAVAKAAEKFGTMFSISSLATIDLESVSSINTPKMFQVYYHKDKGLTESMLEKCHEANFDVLALTVDTVALGNRERDLRTGFTVPLRLSLSSILSFITHPSWGINYLTRSKFELPILKKHIKEANFAIALSDYFSKMIDVSINWKDAEELRKKWGREFCIKGIMSVEDAQKAVDIGATGIIVSNHGGRQLDGSRAPFDQLAEIVDAVGDKIDIICEGGISRGTHVLKALSLGAKACSGARMYLYALAAGGQNGVEKALSNMKSELIRDMTLMGCQNIDSLSRKNIRFRN
ncbi:MAG: alpha-hydroxy-acid oxidizing protein [SAR202 cluster bacterium]|nr:alpha-hydroxy-acid oxidizing enzyme [Chloroflexota bacterium]MQG22582.1 alpha-hydroxy-acid oxidizing protein [SAR202 cluster bacterium]|tara:strand:+ start:1246 stop:2391 length:1146 start_codon:yes stop_codon:yes gene_type:complete